MISIAVVYPQLLGTYGDSGNGLVLYERAVRRGLAATLVHVAPDEDMPDASIYLLGGGEDGPQRVAVDLLASSSFSSRVRDGAFVFAVCAGLQVLGDSFCVEGDDEYGGLSLVDVRTRRGPTRSVGEIMSRVHGKPLVGFENHGGRTELGHGVEPLGDVVRGRGNDGVHDGYRQGRIWATYAHGPVLAMNPWLADELLSELLGQAMSPLMTVADLLYRERCSALGVH